MIPVLVIVVAAVLVVNCAAYWVLREPRIKPVIRHSVAVVAIVLVSVPASVVLTLLLLPLWRWLEERYGIESVGHSGPAEWCFATMFIVCVVALVSLYAFRGKHGP